MGSTPEGRIQARIQKRLTELGVYNFKVHGSAMMPAGLPDIIACVDGAFLGLEVKTPQTLDNVSEVQHYVHGKIRKSGGVVVVVCTVDEAVAAVQGLRIANALALEKKA